MADIEKKVIWSTENVVKIVTLAGFLITHFYMVKQEIHDAKINDIADKRIIDYRLTDLEKCCNIKRPNAQYAVLPKETKIEGE